jgi:hypothetical protein
MYLANQGSLHHTSKIVRLGPSGFGRVQVGRPESGHQAGLWVRFPALRSVWGGQAGLEALRCGRTALAKERKSGKVPHTRSSSRNAKTWQEATSPLLNLLIAEAICSKCGGQMASANRSTARIGFDLSHEFRNMLFHLYPCSLVDSVPVLRNPLNESASFGANMDEPR